MTDSADDSPEDTHPTRGGTDPPAESEEGDGDAPTEPGDRPESSAAEAPPDGDPRTDGNPPAGTTGDGGPHPTRAADTEPDGTVQWLLETEYLPVAVLRDVLSSVAIVATIGLVLFAISGVWPPLVAIESGSMEPHMFRGDLVFIVEDGRFAGDPAVADTGVVTHERGRETDYRSFGSYGNVIVFRPDGTQRTPIIHRARLYVQEGENWYPRADRAYLSGADDCEELANCPAPHAGFITKGDANGGYDQVGYGAATTVVKPTWVKGVATVRIPWLGWIRLQFAELGAGAASTPADAPAVTGPAAASSRDDEPCCRPVADRPRSRHPHHPQ